MKYNDAHIKQIESLPHWRVVVRPEHHDPALISSLSACWKLMEKRKLRLRGWDYPHIDHGDDGRGHGTNWIASGSAWYTYFEYWRFYQSGQFVHLLGLREGVGQEGAAAAQRAAARFPTDADPKSLKGHINITGLLFTVTEVFVFASGLASEGIYAERVRIELDLVNTADFILTADVNRAWWYFCRNSESRLESVWDMSADELVTNAPGKALEATVWFLERFGWMNPNTDQLRRDQEKFISR